MALTAFRQGESRILQAVVNVSPTIDFSTALDIRASLCIAGTEDVKKYALTPVNAGTEYGTLEVDTVTTTINIFVERQDSVSFPVGTVQVVILASFTNVLFPSNIEVKEFILNIGNVQVGKALTEDIG